MDEQKPNITITEPDDQEMARTESTATVAVPRPEQIQPAGLDELKCDQLRVLCKHSNLPVRGRKQELIARLRAKLLGGDRHAVYGHTLCPHCGHPARVISSRLVMVVDGRQVRYRRMQCSGTRRHRFTLKG